MSINLCDVCAEITLDSCLASYTLDLNMGNSVPLVVYLHDFHGHTYTYSVTSGTDGSVTIDTTGFIEGLFHPNHGKLELTVSTSYYEETFETITYNGSPYSCLILSFREIN